MHYIIAVRNNSLSQSNFKRKTNIIVHFYYNKNVKLLVLLKNKTDLPLVTYTVQKNILTFLETDIPTWFYS